MDYYYYYLHNLEAHFSIHIPCQIIFLFGIWQSKCLAFWFKNFLDVNCKLFSTTTFSRGSCINLSWKVIDLELHG